MSPARTPPSDPWAAHVCAVLSGSEHRLLECEEAELPAAVERIFDRTRRRLSATESVASLPVAGDLAAPNVALTEESAQGTVEAVRGLRAGRPLTDPERHFVSAIVLPDERPVFLVQDDTYDALGLYDWVDAQREALKPRLQSIGRIRSESAPYGQVAGTGFLVAPGLLMTNRHVANYFATGTGRQNLLFKPGEAPECDLKQEWQRPEERRLAFDGMALMHPYWDIALIHVSGDLAGLEPLPLASEPPPSVPGRNVVLIGYPIEQYLEKPEWREDRAQVFGSIFNKKRLQPGKLTDADAFGMSIPGSTEKRQVRVVGHDASTLAGNSGTAVIDFETGLVLGVHYAGEPLIGNYAVPAWELVRDPRVREFGVTLVGAAPQAPDPPVEAAWAGLV